MVSQPRSFGHHAFSGEITLQPRREGLVVNRTGTLVIPKEPHQMNADFGARYGTDTCTVLA